LIEGTLQRLQGASSGNIYIIPVNGLRKFSDQSYLLNTTKKMVGETFHSMVQEFSVSSELAELGQKCICVTYTATDDDSPAGLFAVQAISHGADSERAYLISDEDLPDLQRLALEYHQQTTHEK
jgi:hypothetical protein